MRTQRNAEGIRRRHGRRCPAAAGGDCNCKPSYEAAVFSHRHGKKIRKTFPTLAAAKSWRTDALVALRKGQLSPATRTTLRDAWEVWQAGAEAGTIRTRDGSEYKPSARRSYAAAMDRYVLPAIGTMRLSSITRIDVQDVVDELLARGLSASSVRNAIMPLRVVYRRAVDRGDVAMSPLAGLRLPRVELSRTSAASPTDIALLLEPLDAKDRALWACAFYAGLRLGELQALDWTRADIDTRVIRVQRSWDGTARTFIAPKSKAGTRTVPMPDPLRRELIEHRLRTGRSSGLVFGDDGERPFVGSTIWRRARTRWLEAELEPVCLHLCRHAYVSFAIDAGINAKALSVYVGHSQITTTYDRYGHLLPGGEAEAAARLDEYFAANG